MSNNKRVKQVIDFIIKQELDLSEYDKLKPLIKQNFFVGKKGMGIESFSDELIDCVIDWEKGNQNSSLEKLLSDNFVIVKN